MDIDDKTIEILSSKFKKLRNVKTIKLDNNQITELGLKTILKNIKEN